MQKLYPCSEAALASVPAGRRLMMPRRNSGRVGGAAPAIMLLGAMLLGGCSSMNPLLLIDDPFIPESQRVAQAPPATKAPVPEESPAQRLAAAPAREDENIARAAERLGLSVVGAMPSPGTARGELPGPSSVRAYGQLYQYVLGVLEAAAPRRSALLLDPPSVDPAVQPCGDRPSAVLIDLDPASGLLPLAGDEKADPALAGYLEALRQRGVTVFWISGHGPEAASRIRAMLADTALDPAGEDPLVLMRFAGESKQRRRVALGETHCLLAIAGDQRADFDNLYDHVLDPIMAAPLEVLVGQGWFLAPPPVD